MRRRRATADFGTTVQQFFSALFVDPLFLLLLIGLIALGLVVLLALHIHRIHSEEIFLHQAWGANWKGR